jgi:hypothetical protein
MAFPDLTPRTDNRQGGRAPSTIWAEAEGVPVNGNNTFALPFLDEGIQPSLIDEDWIDIRVEALGPSVRSSAFVSLAADKQSMTLSFEQIGADQARVTVALIHTVIS